MNGNDGNTVSLADIASKACLFVAKVAPHFQKMMNGEISKGQFVTYALIDGVPAILQPGAQSFRGHAPCVEINFSQNNLYEEIGHTYIVRRGSLMN